MPPERLCKMRSGDGVGQGQDGGWGAATTPVHIPWESSDGGLQVGSGRGRRDMDRIEGCAGTVFTGLRDRWGREGARIIPRALVTKWATMTGTQVEGLIGEG